MDLPQGCLEGGRSLAQCLLLERLLSKAVGALGGGGGFYFNWIDQGTSQG